MLRKITKKLFIVLVDDDIDDRTIFLEALSEVVENFQLKTFTDGREAVEYFRGEDCRDPDLLFLDINMPLMGGFETLKILRKNLGQTSLPIAMYSTSGLEDDIVKALAAGANVYIRKPSRFEELKLALHKVLMMKMQYPSTVHNFILSV